jgi:exopolyphosphatase/guanosine-5'-triphosphate,3'-diphosphate pyrophosphatase
MKDCVAIFDIGSNAVRLAIYDGVTRAPVRLRTERVLCRLGAGVARTGRLDPRAKDEALKTLCRFAKIVLKLKIRHVRAVATAALRDAADGAAFIRTAQREIGVPILIIGGKEEARLSALGVMMNGLGANGVIGDLGGGSLELVATRDGRVRRKASLPIGTARLLALPSRARRIAAIDAALDKAGVADGGGDFVALGGAWRAMGKAHMAETGHPVPVVDHYAIPASRAAAFAGRLSRNTLPDTDDTGVAALVMERLLKRLKPGRLVFSGTGLREGLVFDMLPKEDRRKDPLIASCLAHVPEKRRHAALARAEKAATSFTGKEARLVAAAALLAGARASAGDVLGMPLYGASHQARAFIALACHGGPVGATTRALGHVLGKKMTALAMRARARIRPS